MLLPNTLTLLIECEVALDIASQREVAGDILEAIAYREIARERLNEAKAQIEAFRSQPQAIRNHEAALGRGA